MSDNAPEKMKLTSMDMAEEKRARLKRLFPEVFTGDRIDFEQLRRVLGDWVEPGKERYGLNWPGKAECMKIIQAPSIATLKPARDESVDFDHTENLFIEGDNLEVLKLLQKAYFGKVKMIYIDPPYNTGKEFIYPDKYQDNLDTYLAYTGQVDDEGKRFATNTDAGGRFHANWLNMMYPRLYLAKNLLREDGVIFISIDDNEQANLKFLCDQIFGEENFVAALSVQLNPRGRHLDKFIAKTHETIIIYAKNIKLETTMYGLEKSGRMIEEYNKEDERGKYRSLGLRNRNQAFNPQTRPSLFYPLYINPKTFEVSAEKSNEYSEETWPITSDGVETCWTWGKEKVQEDSNLLIAEKFGDEWRVYRKDYLLDANGKSATTLSKSLWIDKEINNDYGKKSIKELFGGSVMDFPKSPELIQKLIQIGTSEENIILDFFAGSATTAHSVIHLNSEESTNRKFIMIQLPEPAEEDTVAFKAGYKTIADIGKERMRRVANSISEKTEGELDLGQSSALDLGFKVFKLSRSNFSIWDGDAEKAEDLARQLELHVNHIDPASGPEDILYELLLKAGFELTTRIEKRVMAGKDVYAVAGGALLVCLDKAITPELIDALADADPLQVICLDEGFKGNDQLKTNAVQTFKARAASRETEIVFRTV